MDILQWTYSIFPQCFNDYKSLIYAYYDIIFNDLSDL